jgi:hypothetical protein
MAVCTIIRGVMVSMLTLSAVTPGFNPQLDLIKDYFASGMCCFYVKHATFRCKSKDWLA